MNGSVVNGRVCLTVEYVEGHEPNPHCYVVFRSTITGHDMYHATIQGSSMCIPNVPAHPSYTIIATDGDAVDEINTTASVTILGVVRMCMKEQSALNSALIQDRRWIGSTSNTLLCSSSILVETKG